MATHDAACSCGQLHLTAQGDPVRISICHCLACQRRTGSAFAMQARFPAGEVRVFGHSTEYSRTSDPGRNANLPLLPRVRGHGLLHRRKISFGMWSNPHRRLRRSRVPGADRSSSSSRVGTTGCPFRPRFNATPRNCGSHLPSTRPRSTTRRLTAGASCLRHIPDTATSSTTWPAAKASPAAPPTRSSISAARSTCRRASAPWQLTTPTSTQSAAMPPSRI